MFDFIKNFFRKPVSLPPVEEPPVVEEPPQEPPQEPKVLIIRQDDKGRCVVNGEYHSFGLHWGEWFGDDYKLPTDKWLFQNSTTFQGEEFDDADIEMGELRIVTKDGKPVFSHRGHEFPCQHIYLRHLEGQPILAEVAFHIEFDGKYKAAVKSEYKEWPSPS